MPAHPVSVTRGLSAANVSAPILPCAFPGGQIGYCMVMGANGDHMALSLHMLPGPVTVPLYTVEDGVLKAEPMPLPPYAEGHFAPPTAFNEVALRRLTKLQRGGVIHCEIIRGPEPVQGEPPFLPALQISVRNFREITCASCLSGSAHAALSSVDALNQTDGLVLPPAAPEGAVYDPDEMAEAFIRSLISSKLCPDTILARTEETLTLLEPICQKANIRLVKAEALDELGEAVDAMMARTEESEGSLEGDVLEALREMSVEQIRMLPDFVLEQQLRRASFCRRR